MNRMPARREGLITRSVGAETVVYDGGAAVAHSLSPLATSVFSLCDGRTSVADAALALGVPAADVSTALVTLASLGLVEGAGMSRRSAMQRVGLVGAGALAVSVAAPLAAHAASGTGTGGGTTTTVGNPLDDRDSVDGYQNTTTWATSLTIPANATLTGFQGYASANAGGTEVTFVVIDSATGAETFVGTPVTVNPGSPFSYTPPAGTILASSGYPGFYQTSAGVIPYDDGTGDAIKQTGNGDGPPPAVGATPTAESNLTRTYSFTVSYTS